MGANARGGGSYKNMIVQFASKPNFLETKLDLFHSQVSKSGCAAAHLPKTPNSAAPKCYASIICAPRFEQLQPPLIIYYNSYGCNITYCTNPNDTLAPLLIVLAVPGWLRSWTL